MKHETLHMKQTKHGLFQGNETGYPGQARTPKILYLRGLMW